MKLQKIRIKTFTMILFLLIIQMPIALAGDVELYGLELEELLDFSSAFLALGLFALTLVAYKRTRNTKLLYVSIAFILFSLKGLLTSHELFIREISIVDPIASFLGFVIMLCFFLGVLKK